MSKIITKWLLILSLLLVFNSIALSQKESDWDKYKYRTLSEIVSFNSESTDKILKDSKLEEKQGFIGTEIFPSRVRVQFVGTPRLISASRLGFIKQWGKLLNIDEKIISLYENEVLFKECDREYWIPVQKKVGETLSKKLKSGDMATLLVVHIGGLKEANKKEFDWLFLLNEFEK